MGALPRPVALPTPPKPAGQDSQMMQQAISAAISAAMAPFIAQTEALKQEVADMQEVEMELEEEAVSETSSTVAGPTKRSRKLKLVKKGSR